MTDTITFTHDTAKQLRAAYKQAVADKQDQFTFQGKEFVTAFAKYMCEYLVMKGLLEKET